MENDRAHVEDRLTKKKFQFSISQIILCTVVTAVVVACVKYQPLTVVVLILLAFLGVPIMPFAILFAAIAFSPEKKGYLSANQGSLKILVAAWLICLAISASTCLLIYLGLVY